MKKALTCFYQICKADQQFLQFLLELTKDQPVFTGNEKRINLMFPNRKFNDDDEA
jgi:hypothetical protein